jgi:uncharacterized protein
MATKTKTIQVEGMTCVSCENLIEDELLQIKGVKKVVAHHKKGSVAIEFDDEKDLDSARTTKIIKDLGYEIVTGKRKKRFFKINNTATAKQWFWALFVLVIIALAYQLFRRFDFMSVFNFDVSRVSLGVAVLIGVVASISTCLAVVGGVVISFATKYKSKGSFYKRNVRPHLLFHVGRLATFFVLGGVLGLFGAFFNFSGSLTGWFTVLVGFVMLILGLNILGFLPSPSSFGVRMPKGVMKHWNKLKDSEHKLAPLILGGLTFFLPCGFTQSMQLFAVASGSFWLGGLSLFLFALGTAPVLIGLGIAASRFQNAKMIVFKLVAGFIVLIFAFYTAMTGFALAGINLDWGFQKDYGKTISSTDEQVIEMVVNYKGYSPNVFTLKKDVPVRWYVNVEQMTGCTNEIIIPSLKISKKLSIGQNIIEFTPTKEGNMSFSCWMGMVRGKFIITASGESARINSGFDESLLEGTICDGGGACGGSCGAVGCGCGG